MRHLHITPHLIAMLEAEGDAMDQMLLSLVSDSSSKSASSNGGEGESQLTLAVAIMSWGEGREDRAVRPLAVVEDVELDLGTLGVWDMGVVVPELW
jgi:hypothetical protein